jgi:hypothetical protein
MWRSPRITPIRTTRILLLPNLRAHRPPNFSARQQQRERSATLVMAVAVVVVVAPISIFLPPPSNNIRSPSPPLPRPPHPPPRTTPRSRATSYLVRAVRSSRRTELDKQLQCAPRYRHYRYRDRGEHSPTRRHRLHRSCCASRVSGLGLGLGRGGAVGAERAGIRHDDRCHLSAPTQT